MSEPNQPIIEPLGASMPPFRQSSFRFVGDPKACDHSARPGLYKFTFPVCEVKPVHGQFRLFARMVMTGPLECQVPRGLAYELDVTGDLAMIQEEFGRLHIPLANADGLEEACKALLLRVIYVDVYRYLERDAQARLGYALMTEEDAKAHLEGLPLPTRTYRISGSLYPPLDETRKAKWTPSVRKMMSREIIVWATILSCKASPLAERAGYEVAWEVHIDNYLDNPLIHRWTQRVDNIQAYEELRRDLEVLCVDLMSYGDIESACSKAVGQNIVGSPTLSDLPEANHALLEHFTKKQHQLPPLHERMTRAEAEEYVRQHRLGSFAENLRAFHFLDEGAPMANPEAALSPIPPSPNPNRPMKPLFGDTLASYDLVQMPVEPYASESIARVGTYWLRATHCTARKRHRFYFTHIRLEMVCQELDPPFRAVYELNRKLTYTQLCTEFRKLQVMVHSKEGIKPACKSVLGDIGWVRCLPEDAPDWLCQNAGSN